MNPSRDNSSYTGFSSPRGEPDTETRDDATFAKFVSELALTIENGADETMLGVNFAHADFTYDEYLKWLPSALEVLAARLRKDGNGR